MPKFPRSKRYGELNAVFEEEYGDIRLVEVVSGEVKSDNRVEPLQGCVLGSKLMICWSWKENKSKSEKVVSGVIEMSGSKEFSEEEKSKLKECVMMNGMWKWLRLHVNDVEERAKMRDNEVNELKEKMYAKYGVKSCVGIAEVDGGVELLN
jgi:sugar-specific transcriptional regulator TrmB